MDSNKTFARLEKLFNVSLLKDVHVLVAGCGSGGGTVAQQLVMSGVRRLTLVDRDILDPENVIRHVCGRRYVGWKKTAAMADILRDRNPNVEIRELELDIIESPEFPDLVNAADVVIMATDNDASRWKMNDLCVRSRKPFAVAKVFTRGIGGEVFAYRPGEGGCLACLEAVLERTQYRSGVREIDFLDEDEREAIYGLEDAEFKDSPGLNVDISFITSFHTRFVLDLIARGLPERPAFLAPIEENYLVWGNRPVPPFERNFQIQRITVHPRTGCMVCGGPAS